MVNVVLPDSTDAKLRLLAQPFETREALIDRMADAELARRKGHAGAADAHAAERGPLVLDPHAPESLTHTRVVAASVAGQPISKPDWNSLVDHLHVLAHRKLGSFDAVERASSANIRRGKHTKDGYHYLPQADLSVQGVDANKAWDHTLRLAQALGVDLEVTFRWREREDAVHPGRSGALRWSPPASLPTDVFAEMSSSTVQRERADDSRERIYGRAVGE